MDETVYTNDLKQHEAKEMQLLQRLEDTIMQKETIMDTPTIENVFKPGTGFATGDGLGMGMGGGLGLVALLALLGRNNGGVFGGNGDGGSAVNQLTLGQIQSTLGDIKAAVPLAEAQVQLALAGAQHDINANVNDHAQTLNSGISQTQLQVNQLAAQLGDKVDSGFAANAIATLQAQYNVTQAVNSDGDKTRALIQSIDKQNDSRLITSQANEIVELRQEQRRQGDRHGIEIQMTNNQNQNQLQFQAQQQVLGTLANGLVDAIQSIRATNQAINIGAGTQTANPTNTNTNVRA